MKELFKRVKQTTSTKTSDFESLLGCTKQNIYQGLAGEYKNNSTTTAVTYAMEIQIDNKISYLEQQIEELKDLKFEVRRTFLNKGKR